MNGKMLSRDLNAHRFACGCCFEYSYKGRKKDRRTARRRENSNFRQSLALGRDI